MYPDDHPRRTWETRPAFYINQQRWATDESSLTFSSDPPADYSSTPAEDRKQTERNFYWTRDTPMFRQTTQTTSVGYPESSQRTSLDDFAGSSLGRSADGGVYDPDYQGSHIVLNAEPPQNTFPPLHIPSMHDTDVPFSSNQSLTEPWDQPSFLPGRHSQRRSSAFEDVRTLAYPTQRQPLLDEGQRNGFASLNDYPLTTTTDTMSKSLTSPTSLYSDCVPLDNFSDSTVTGPTLGAEIFTLASPGSPIPISDSSSLIPPLSKDAAPKFLPQTSLSNPECDVLSATPKAAVNSSRERSLSSTPGTQQPRPKKKSKMHECEICHKFFPRPSGLQIHMNTHTDSKPYPCSVPGCNKRFAVRSNAKRHLRTHGIVPNPANDAEPVPYIVDFNDPIVPPQSSTPQLQMTKVPIKLQWVPNSLTTRTNVKSLRTCSEADSESDDGGDGSDREATVGSLAPALAMPLRTVVPSLPSNPNDEFFEERDSYLPAGSHPYHSSQFRGLPGPAPPLQTSVY